MSGSEPAKERSYLPACEFVVRIDRKGNAHHCGCGAEAEYKIEGGLASAVMVLCSAHANDLQQKFPHWKFVRVEPEYHYRGQRRDASRLRGESREEF